METNKFIIGLGISYDPEKVKRIETEGKNSLYDLFSDYGSPDYNQKPIIGFIPNPNKNNDKKNNL